MMKIGGLQFGENGELCCFRQALFVNCTNQSNIHTYFQFWMNYLNLFCQTDLLADLSNFSPVNFSLFVVLLHSLWIGHTANLHIVCVIHWC